MSQLKVIDASKKPLAIYCQCVTFLAEEPRIWLMAVDLVARKYVTPADMACSTGFMVFHVMPALRSRVKTQLATTSRSLLSRLLGSV